MYSLDDFDKHSCLKPPLSLYVFFLIGMKNIILILLPAITSIKTRSSNLDYFRELVQPEMLIADLLVLVVFLSLIFRKPGAKEIWQKVWRKGRFILIAAFSYQLSIVLPYQLHKLAGPGRVWYHESDFIQLAIIAGYIVVLIGLIRSKRMKDTFADWPENA